MRRGSAITLVVLAILTSLLALLASARTRSPPAPPLPGAAAPGAANPLPHACAPSYAYDRLADLLGGQPQRMGLAAATTAPPPCL